MRRQCIATVITFAATLMLTHVRCMALVMRLHVQLQCSFRLKLLAAVWHLANDPIRTTVQFRVAPQIVDSSETTIAAFHLADVILALQMRLLVSF